MEDRIQKTDGEDEETVLDFLAQYEVYGYVKKWVVDLVRRICKVGKGAQVGKFTILLIFLRQPRRWAFPFLNYTHQAWDPPTFRRFFGLIFLPKPPPLREKILVK